MKIFRILTILGALTCAVGTLSAKPIPGPKGGRILTIEAPHAEFFVEQDHTATVTFYDNALKTLPPDDQIVSAVAETKAGKVKLAFAKTAYGFVSAGPLPKGDDYNIVIQIKSSANATPKNYRVYFEDQPCEKCHRPEYACVCESK